MNALTVPAMLDRCASERPDVPAITIPGGDQLTYARWRDASCRLARALMEFTGVKPGERVAVPCDPAGWTEYAVAYVAVQRTGATPVPLVRAYGSDHASGVVDRLGIVVSVGDAPTPVVVNRHAGHSLSADPLDMSSPDGIAEIIYTSGTTGRSRGVAASHANVLETMNHRADARPQAILHALVPGTGYGQMQLASILSAAPYRMIAMARMDPREMWRIIDGGEVTTVALVPAAARMLVDAMAHELSPDVSRVRIVRVAGAFSSPRDLARLQDAFDAAQVHNVYSTIEAGPARVTAIYNRDRPESVGRPSDAAKVRVVGDDDEPVPSGEVAHIQLKPSAQRRSYVDPPDTEGTVFKPDGWVSTGDMGRLDEDGFLYITDRRRDVLSVGGMKAGTVAIEAAMRAHDAVSDIAVIKAAHPLLGDVPVAYVVPSGPVETSELRRYAEDHLGSLAPADYRFVDSIPLNVMGKPDKVSLERRYKAEQESAHEGSAI